jgi:hypothetical protein
MTIIGEEIRGKEVLLKSTGFKPGEVFKLRVYSMQVDLIKGVEIRQKKEEGSAFNQAINSYVPRSRFAEAPELTVSSAKASSTMNTKS